MHETLNRIVLNHELRKVIMYIKTKKKTLKSSFRAAKDFLKWGKLSQRFIQNTETSQTVEKTTPASSKNANFKGVQISAYV